MKIIKEYHPNHRHTEWVIDILKATYADECYASFFRIEIIRYQILLAAQLAAPRSLSSTELVKVSAKFITSVPNYSELHSSDNSDNGVFSTSSVRRRDYRRQTVKLRP
jgi:hypothetical protein